MNFELDDEHYSARDALVRYLGVHAGPQQLRQFWDSDYRGLEIWSGLADLGVLGLTVPVEHGGQGLGVCDSVLVFEELGRFAVPHPVAEAVGVVAPLLARFGDAQLRSAWLSGMASGSVLTSVQDGWSGQAGWGAEAQLVLVADDDGVSLCVPAPASQMLAGAQDPARRPARLGCAEQVGRLHGAETAAFLRNLARTVYAQQLLGLASAVIDRAVEYAKVRQQFGRPIGSFQAVKHMLANAFVAVQTARRSAWLAAWYLDRNDPRAAEAACVAKGSAGEAAIEASYAALQVHGAIGYTWECDLHLWLKRIHVLEAMFGGARDQWNTLAAIYFDEAEVVS